MKKIFLIFILTILVVLSVSFAVSVSADGDDSKYIPKLVETDTGDKLVFEPELARIARRMSSDAYGIEKGSKAADIANAMKEEGFLDIQQSHTSDNSTVNKNYPNNFLVGAKTFEVDGIKKHVVAIAFRGTDLDAGILDAVKDVAADLENADYNGFHKGFYTSASNAWQTLKNMKFDSLDLTFEEYLDCSKKSDDYYILITGHSFGGAVANILAGEILAEDDFVKSNTMCYTFATPLVCSSDKAGQKDAYNIFNIINTEDNIPKVGYGLDKGSRLGVDLKSTVSLAKIDILFLNHKIDGAYEKVTNQVIDNIDSLYKYTVLYYNEWRADLDCEEDVETDESTSEFEDRNKDGITVYVDGKKLDFDVEPQLINNRTMVPMRAIFEALGAEVSWDNETRTAYGKTDDVLVEITIGREYLLRNDSKIALDSPAIVISGRTLVPVRAIAESLNCNVEWIGDLQVVNITN